MDGKQTGDTAKKKRSIGQINVGVRKYADTHLCTYEFIGDISIAVRVYFVNPSNQILGLAIKICIFIAHRFGSSPQSLVCLWIYFAVELMIINPSVDRSEGVEAFAIHCTKLNTRLQHSLEEPKMSM